MSVPASYLEVCNILDLMDCKRVDGCSFYEEIFPDNECSGDLYTDFSHPNAIYLFRPVSSEPLENTASEASKTRKKERVFSRRIMLNDTWEDDYASFVEGNEHAFCSGLAYCSRSNKLQYAQHMNALIFDLDGVGENELRNLLLRFGGDPKKVRTLPVPTYIVASGSGVHLYYVFDEPIDLFPNIKLQLKSMKHSLTFRIWEYGCTSTYQDIQYQSINQGFRMVGSVNEKYKEESDDSKTELVAFEFGKKVSLSYLNEYVEPENRVDLTRAFSPSKMTRAEAKAAYPDWYKKVVLEKDYTKKKWDIAGKVHGDNPYALYDWWLNKLKEVKGGHRYFFMMCLVIYACKCDVPRKKLKKDLMSVYDELRSVTHTNDLTIDDVNSALEIYSREYYNFTIEDIERLSGIHIKRNKRNYRKQKEHLQADYFINAKGRPVINTCKVNREMALKYMSENHLFPGAPTKKDIVIKWKKENPTGRKMDCHRDTGLSRSTIDRWWEENDESIPCPFDRKCL